MVAYCDFHLAKEGVIGLRPRYLQGLDGGATRAAASAANVTLGTLVDLESGRCSTHERDAGIGCR